MATQQLDLDRVVDVLRDAIERRRPDRLREMLRGLSSDDAAGALDELSPVELAAVFTLLGDEQLAEVLENLDATEAAHLLGKLSRAQAADLLEEMAPDDAADVVEELDPDDAEAILVEMEGPERDDLRAHMAYPPESAAGRMTQEVVTVGPDITAEQALVAIRRAAEEAETIYYVYVTDHSNHLLGVLSLRDLVLSSPNTPISQITRRDLARVPDTADQEVAARMLADRGLLALPVVDAQNHLLGIITADDVTDVLEEEASEDIQRLGGSEPLDVPYLRSSVFSLVRKRAVWLLLLFVGGAFTGDVLSFFQDTIQEQVALMFFVPMLIGMGGNVGSQTVTLLVRAMAVGEVRMRDIGRVLRKEWLVAGLLGIVLGLTGFARAAMIGSDPLLSISVALTAFCVAMWAATVAAILPLVLRKVGVDPAVVSAPFISTFVDATGLFIYFTIARLVMHL